jgi:peptidoglycan/LPS O-acetylase OafA/YrhL
MSGQWPADEPVPSRPAGLPQKRPPRWGLRTLGFLGLALLAIITSVSLGGHTFGTLGSLVFGLVGAAYCSIKGLRVALEHDVVRMFTGRDRAP